MTVSVLSRIRVLDCVVFHERLQIDHGEGAVFWVVAELLGRHSLFQNALKDHAIQWTVTHASVVLNQVRLSMGGEVDRLLACSTRSGR